MARKKTDVPLSVEIRRARYQKLVLIEITEAELDEIERGSPESILLTLSIFFLSVSLSFLASLLTASFSSDRVFLVFLLITLVGAAVGAVLLILWLAGRRRTTSMVRRIRARLDTEVGIQEPTEIVEDPNAPPPGPAGAGEQ